MQLIFSMIVIIITKQMFHGANTFQKYNYGAPLENLTFLYYPTLSWIYSSNIYNFNMLIRLQVFTSF